MTGVGLRSLPLTSMRGVGPTLAFTLIALLPELGQISRKQIAALVGLAPYDFDSGKLNANVSRQPANATCLCALTSPTVFASAGS